MDVPASLLDFSLVQGTLLGPRHRAHPRRASLTMRVVFLTLVSWLPLLVLSLLGGEPAVARGFLRDLGTHVAFLVSLPLLVASERYIDLNLSAAVRQFVVSDLIDAKHLATFERIANDVVRVRRSAIIEAGLLIVSVAVSFVNVPLLTSRPAWLHAQPQGPLTLAGWWYLAVSMPLLRFLFLRWLWRGVLWARFLFKVSRLPLALVPTHPDAAGGLGFLGTVQASFSLIVFAVAATITAHRLTHGPTTDLTDYALHLFAFALICLVIVYAPLAAFFRQLLRTKRMGGHHFSAVAAWHSQRFEERWFHRDPPEGMDPLTAHDFSSLADLGTSFGAARRMRWFPVDVRAALAVIVAAMVPIVPLLFADRRFVEVVLELGKSMF
ncbi:hypothetical protein [Corallococcus sp. EGB]|uniref:hypothetical protein n=1 Tax=Corallococcus sp. EGB TaxID=1521117 RepID=UPI001CBC9D2E|nr:hypothetical protein [Corallococcus sp. EGB]